MSRYDSGEVSHETSPLFFCGVLKEIAEFVLVVIPHQQAQHVYKPERPEYESDQVNPLIIFRWVMGLVLGGLGTGFFILTMVANGFRKSFGSSELNPLLRIIPIAAMLVLLAGLIAPTNRILLHIGAVCAVAIIGYCIWVMIYESGEVVWLALIYMILWLYFYWRAIMPASTP